MALLIANDHTSTSISTTASSTATTTTTTTTTATSTTTTLTHKTTTSTTTSSYILAHIRPLLSTTLKTLYQTHALLFSTLLLLFVRSFSLLHSIFHHLPLSTSLATKLFVYRTLIFTRHAIMETASHTWSIWDSRKARQIRKKIEFEFFVWILGPGGNLLCFLLWPGWIVLGVMIWGLSCLMTGVSAAMLPVSG
ncbi:hypothetical protein B0H65DRAFT_282409 [Neurospora tetraspora]|uniref:Uncharacterized protein n=1 Tax=Neurospora tetraspora TaxID=94610 RepID=A0AAE0J9F0_9PEZI|nr:hypothetical protein B0H65DRAFT_282409 [Neurospora tetraspora]